MENRMIRLARGRDSTKSSSKSGVWKNIWNMFDFCLKMMQLRQIMRPSITPNTPNASKKAAFTLIELLTVIAVIAVLGAILLPVIGNVREQATKSKALNSARQIGLANLMYAQANNGEIMGIGWDNWNDTLAFYRGFAEYLGAPGDMTVEERDSALAQVVDPSVPEDLVIYGTTTPWTWSFNYIFNVRGGRVSEGVRSPEEWEPGSQPRRLTEFDEPASMIYAVSGSYQFTVETAADADLLGEPTRRQPIFYYYGSNDTTPAVFLDGHAEMMTYPISEEKINPRLKYQ
jgi:prepilin-type N-terminal cleavage/methylation domain-containing protein